MFEYQSVIVSASQNCLGLSHHFVRGFLISKPITLPLSLETDREINLSHHQVLLFFTEVPFLTKESFPIPIGFTFLQLVHFLNWIFLSSLTFSGKIDWPLLPKFFPLLHSLYPHPCTCEWNNELMRHYLSFPCQTFQITNNYLLEAFPNKLLLSTTSIFSDRFLHSHSK